MHVVIDQVFCDLLELSITEEEIFDHPELMSPMHSHHDRVVQLAAFVGIELLDYTHAKIDEAADRCTIRLTIRSAAQVRRDIESPR